MTLSLLLLNWRRGALGVSNWYAAVRYAYLIGLVLLLQANELRQRFRAVFVCNFTCICRMSLCEHYVTMCVCVCNYKSIKVITYYNVYVSCLAILYKHSESTLNGPKD